MKKLISKKKIFQTTDFNVSFFYRLNPKPSLDRLEIHKSVT